MAVPSFSTWTWMPAAVLPSLIAIHEMTYDCSTSHFGSLALTLAAFQDQNTFTMKTKKERKILLLSWQNKTERQPNDTMEVSPHTCFELTIAYNHCRS